MEVYLISCTKKKQTYKCSAEEMYTPSTLFKANMNYAINHLNNSKAQIYILSAKYHLLPLTKIIEPYDKTLKKMKSSEIEEWGKTVYNEMKSIFDMENTNFIFLAGNDYIEPLRKYLNINKCFNPVPQEYRSIGKRMKWLKENCMIEDRSIAAIKLRNKEYLKKVPSDMPGWYRWWAPIQALEILLNSTNISNKYLKDLLPHLTTKYIDGTEYYYVYVGIAVKESIRNRLNWHVNQPHTKSSVESGFLSTLRQTISSLAAGNQYDEEATNKLIDLFVVEYHPIDLPIKSNEAKEKIEAIEKEELKTNNIPLNLRDNKNEILKKYLIELSKARKNSK